MTYFLVHNVEDNLLLAYQHWKSSSFFFAQGLITLITITMGTIRAKSVYGISKWPLGCAEKYIKQPLGAIRLREGSAML